MLKELTRSDWLRLLGMEPNGCFVADVDDAPVGTTATCVGSPSRRRRTDNYCANQEERHSGGTFDDLTYRCRRAFLCTGRT